MAGIDASGSLTPLRRESRNRAGGIVFDARRVAQPSWSWFDPAQWGDRAVPVGSGGRGSAWFVNAPFGTVVLRHYLRGGMAAKVSRDRYLWQGVERTRSLAEFAMLETLHGMGLPVPAPVAACYLRRGATYRASIIVERIPGVVSFADRIAIDGDGAPWEQAGVLIARFHRAGVDHADLNAHNILFDRAHSGWLIDFDRGVMRAPSARWRENNLARLKRSLLKVRGARSIEQAMAGFARLHAAYADAWTAAAT